MSGRNIGCCHDSLSVLCSQWGSDYTAREVGLAGGIGNKPLDTSGSPATGDRLRNISGCFLSQLQLAVEQVLQYVALSKLQTF